LYIISKAGTLGMVKKAGTKVSKEMENNEIAYFNENRKQQLVSLQEK
jgi:hypothetical protein